MEAKAYRFPMDYDAIQKGDVIETEVIERWIEKSRNDPNFEIYAMQFAKKVMEELDDRGRPMQLVVRKKCIHVLTDPENIKHQNHLALMGRRKIANSIRGLVMVDERNLTDEEREHLDQSLASATRQLSAIQQARREVRLEYKRGETPSLRSSYEQPKLAGGTEKPEDSTRNQDEST